MIAGATEEPERESSALGQLSLRDRFALKLVGLVYEKGTSRGASDQEIAERTWSLADALIERRERREFEQL